jgi:hypothetical protein
MAAEEKWLFRRKPMTSGESREFFIIGVWYHRDSKWECEWEGLRKILYQANNVRVFLENAQMRTCVK